MIDVSAYDDYRYSAEAEEHDLMLIWRCDKCGDQYEDCPGVNEGGQCSCGGGYINVGESYK